VTRLFRDAGVLLSRPTRVRLLFALTGSIITAGLDMLGVAAFIPLMQLLTGASPQDGPLGWVTSLLGGDTDQRRLAIIIATAIVVIFSIKGTLTILFRWWQLGFLASQEIETSVQLLRGFMRSPFTIFRQRNTADMLRILGDAVGQTYGQVVVGVLGVVTELLTIVGLGLLLLVASPVPGAVVALYFACAALLLNRYTRPRAAKAGEDTLEYSRAAFKAALHCLGGMKEISIRHTGEAFLTEFRRDRVALATARRSFLFLGELPKYLLEIVFVLGVALMAAVSFSVQSTSEAVAGLAILVAAGTRTLPSLVRLMANLGGVRYGMAGLTLVIEELQTARDIEKGKLDGPSRPLKAGDVEISNVRFRYPDGGVDVLDGISVHIPSGSSLAVVGSSGSGKTTLIDTLLGLHTPTSGAITVNGVNIHERLTDWQSSIGLVPQEVFLLDDTLAANVRFGVAPDVDDEQRVRSALIRAQLDSLVEELPEGIETMLGERGSRLSGGQRQRIGIARALYSQPALIVLDEATSALDNLTEKLISETIHSLHGDTTLVIVAHRLSTVRDCDQLIFLKNGVVESRGTFDQVYAANADFARLVRLGVLDSSDSTSGARAGDL
jgi:ABC-type multidrug transport system fused ATPase/permease subunit